MSISNPTSLYTGGSNANNHTSGSLSPTAGSTLVLFIHTVFGGATPPSIGTPGGTLTATWQALDTEQYDDLGIAISVGSWWCSGRDHSGSGTVASGTWTGASTIDVTVIEIVSNNVLTLAGNGSDQATASPVDTTFSGTGEQVGVYFSVTSAAATDRGWSPVSGATELNDVWRANTNYSYGYDNTGAIVSPIGASITPDDEVQVAMAVTFREPAYPPWPRRQSALLRM